MIRLKGDKPIDYSHLTQKEADKMLRSMDNCSSANPVKNSRIPKATLGFGTGYQGHGNVYTRGK